MSYFVFQISGKEEIDSKEVFHICREEKWAKFGCREEVSILEFD